MRGDHGVVARDFHCPDAVEDALPGRPQLHLADQGEKKLIFAVGALLWSRARSGRFTHGDLAFECGRKGRCGEGRKGLSGESPFLPSPNPTPTIFKDFRRYRIPVHVNGNSLTVVLCLKVGRV